MKKLLLLLAIVLALPSMYALTETKEKLNINSTATTWGKTIKIIDVTPDGTLKYEVDGKKDIIKYGDYAKETNGMQVDFTNFTYIDIDYVEITLGLTVNSQCGDNVCDTNMSESNDTCCTDCGCRVGECLSNICTIMECKKDTECEDNNNCTINTCGNSGKCTYTPIVICNPGDGCCPTGCAYENDTDCKKIEEPKGECANDSECNDNNACTTDKCDGKPTKCNHQAKEGCSYQEKCYNITERSEKTYCTETGMKEQKQNKEQCTNNYECTDNACTKNLCGKESKAGLYIGIAVAVLTFIALMFMGHSIFKKKEQNLKPQENSETT